MLEGHWIKEHVFCLHCASARRRRRRRRRSNQADEMPINVPATKARDKSLAFVVMVNQ